MDHRRVGRCVFVVVPAMLVGMNMAHGLMAVHMAGTHVGRFLHIDMRMIVVDMVMRTVVVALMIMTTVIMVTVIVVAVIIVTMIMVGVVTEVMMVPMLLVVSTAVRCIQWHMLSFPRDLYRELTGHKRAA